MDIPCKGQDLRHIPEMQVMECRADSPVGRFHIMRPRRPRLGLFQPQPGAAVPQVETHYISGTISRKNCMAKSAIFAQGRDNYTVYI